MEIDVKTIRELIESLDRSRLDRMELHTEGFNLLLERNRPASVTYTAAAQPVTATVLPAQAGAPVPASADALTDEAPAPRGSVVKSPIVGTFYASASPDKPPFVTVGDHVAKGDVLCIIESMKLMNEVNSEFSGTVTEILVESGKPVEFGQPLMRIE